MSMGSAVRPRLWVAAGASWAAGCRDVRGVLVLPFPPPSAKRAEFGAAPSLKTCAVARVCAKRVTVHPVPFVRGSASSDSSCNRLAGRITPIGTSIGAWGCKCGLRLMRGLVAAWAS